MATTLSKKESPSKTESTLTKSERRTAAADGPVRVDCWAAAGAWSTWSVKPQRGITA